MSPRPVTDTPSSAPSASASPSPNDHAAASAAMENWLPAYVVILVLFALSLLCSVVLIIFLFRKHRPSSDSAARPPRRSGVVTAPYGPPQYMRHGGNEPFELQALRGGAQDRRPGNATHDTSTGGSSRPGGNETDGNNKRPTPPSGVCTTTPPPRSLPATGYNCHRHPARPSLHEILSRPSDEQDDHGRRRYPPGVNPYTMEITRRPTPSSSPPRVSCRSSSDAAAALLAEGGGVAGVNKPAPPAVAAAAAAPAFVPPSPAVTECCWKDGEEHDAKPSRGTRRKGGWISRRRSSRLGGESTRERVRRFVKGEYTRSHQRGSKVERGEQTRKQIIIA